MNSKRRLLLAISAFMLEVGSASRADAQSEAGTSAFIKRYAAHYNVPSELIAAFIDVEARWNPASGLEQGGGGADAVDARDGTTIRSTRPLRSRAEHCGGHALPHHADVRVPRSDATQIGRYLLIGCEGLLDVTWTTPDCVRISSELPVNE